MDGNEVIDGSNVAGIAKGLYSVEDLAKVNNNMLSEVKKAGGKIKATYYCIHKDEDNCPCRKPKTGLIEQACEGLDVDIKKTFFIGDKKTDIETGEKAGCKTILVLSGKVKKGDVSSWFIKPDYIKRDLKDAVDDIIIGIPDNEQHTNLGDGIKQALEELKKNGRDKSKKAIIALTDGVASRPLDPIDSTNETYAEDYAALQADQVLKEDMLLYVIGLGEDINTELLTFDIASSPEKFYQAASSEDLALVYADIAQAVCEEDVFLYEIYIRISDGDTSQ